MVPNFSSFDGERYFAVSRNQFQIHTNAENFECKCSMVDGRLSLNHVDQLAFCACSVAIKIMTVPSVFTFYIPWHPSM